MNQILATENVKKSRSSATKDVKNIIRFFAFSIIIFGMILIGQGSYAMYREAKGKNNTNLPIVNIQRAGDAIVVSVQSKNMIEKFRYNWGNADETVIPVEDTYIEEKILLPLENSILNIIIEDETGRAIKYRKECIVEGLDLTKPTLNVIEENKTEDYLNIKITAIDEQLDYIIYRKNQDEEVKIFAEEGENSIIYVLKFERGEHILNVTAVDKSGNVSNVEDKIIKVSTGIPIIKIIQDPDNKKHFVYVKDYDGIKDIEITLNGVIYKGEKLNVKEMNIPIPFEEGRNEILIKITNINGIVAESRENIINVNGLISKVSN